MLDVFFERETGERGKGGYPRINGDDYTIMKESVRRERRKRWKEEGIENVPSLTFRLEKSEDVVLPDGTLYVSYDRTGRVVHELDANLGDSTTGTGTTEDLDNLGELDRDLVRGSLLYIWVEGSVSESPFRVRVLLCEVNISPSL